MAINTPATEIPIEGVPIGWLFLINETAGTLAEKHLFDNLQQMSYVSVVPEEENAGNLDIVRADGAIIRFPKTTTVISGVDESVIANTAAVGDESLKGEMTMVINEAPVGSASWSEFFQELIDDHGAKWLIAFPTGITYAGREGLTPPGSITPDGYAFMIGTITNNIEALVSENPTNVTLNFKSVKNSGLEQADLTAVGLFTGIDWKRGGSTVSAVAPADLSATEADALLLGELVVRKVAVYT